VWYDGLFFLFFFRVMEARIQEWRNFDVSSDWPIFCEWGLAPFQFSRRGPSNLDPIHVSSSFTLFFASNTVTVQKT
jgi:hypothetical protein